MSTATLQYLLDQDRTPSLEWPEGFDLRSELEKVRDLGPRLREITGLPLRLDDKVESASFFAEWSALEAVARPWPGHNAGVKMCIVGIRFSAHGRMFTVWGNCPDQPLAESTVAAINDYLGPLGYVHVPRELLHASHPTHGPDITWCNRFFSYQDQLGQPHIRGFLRERPKA